MARVARIVVVIALALGVGACGTAPGPTGTPPPTAVPTTEPTTDPSLVAVPTQEPEPSGTPRACMASFVDGTLVADDRWGLVLGEVDGSVREVVWPYGYSARRTGGRRVLFDATGAIVASERDRVRIGGGEMHDGAWLGCGGITVLAGR